MTAASEKKKAIALKYIEGTQAPVILAKGEGQKAQIMLEEAEKQGIPVAEDKILVDMLGLSTEGSFVPENTWRALAAIFSFILEESDEHKNQG